MTALRGGRKSGRRRQEIVQAHRVVVVRDDGRPGAEVESLQKIEKIVGLGQVGLGRLRGGSTDDVEKRRADVVFGRRAEVSEQVHVVVGSDAVCGGVVLNSDRL